MKKFFLITLFNCIAYNSIAYDFEYGGFYYIITSVSEKTASFCAPPNDVSFPKEVAIPSFVYYDGKQLTVTGIEGDSFGINNEIESLSIPGTVLNLYTGTFDKCKKLTKVTFENGTEPLECGFGPHYSSRELEINGYYGSGNYGLFHNCPLEYLYLGRNIVRSSPYNSYEYSYRYLYPFCYNKYLKKVVMGEKCTSIGPFFFYDCKQLETVEFSSNMSKIDNNAFFGCTSLKSIFLPNSLLTIGSEAFGRCELLSEITIPSKVEVINRLAFCDCQNIKMIKIMGCPDIYDGSFGWDDSDISAEVYSYSSVPPKTHNSVFSHKTHLKTLYVPKDSKDIYSQATEWKEFWNIVEMGDNTITVCEMPTISFQDKQLIISSPTPNSRCYYKIECVDECPFVEYTESITMKAEYIISAYAISEGYNQSDITYAKLIFDIDNIQIENSNGIIKFESKPIMISNEGTIIKICGVKEKTVSFFNLAGQYLGCTEVFNGNTIYNSYIHKGETVLIKVGNKCFKYLLR